MAIHIYILLEAENKGDFLNHVQEAVHNILFQYFYPFTIFFIKEVFT